MRFRVLLHQNYNSVTPIIYRRQTTFIIEVTSQKSTICEKIQKNAKKMPKIVIFWKFLTSVTSDFIARYNTPTCAWSKFLLKKSEKISKKFVRGWLFPKSRDFTPPQLAKSATKNTLIKMRPKILSVSHRFRPACKFLAISNG